MSRGLAMVLVAALASACGADPRAPVRAEDLPGPTKKAAKTKKAKPRKKTKQANNARPAERGEAPASVTVGDLEPGGEAADYSELKVFAWQWRNAEGKPNLDGNAYPIGRTPYWFEIGGLTERDGKYHLGIKSRIVNAEGKVMYEAEAFNVVELAVDPAHPQAAQHEDSAQVPITGEFHLELDLRDEPTGQLVTHSQRLQIR